MIFESASSTLVSNTSRATANKHYQPAPSSSLSIDQSIGNHSDTDFNRKNWNLGAHFIVEKPLESLALLQCSSEEECTPKNHYNCAPWHSQGVELSKDSHSQYKMGSLSLPKLDPSLSSKLAPSSSSVYRRKSSEDFAGVTQFPEPNNNYSEAKLPKQPCLDEEKENCWATATTSAAVLGFKQSAASNSNGTSRVSGNKKVLASAVSCSSSEIGNLSDKGHSSVHIHSAPVSLNSFEDYSKMECGGDDKMSRKEDSATLQTFLSKFDDKVAAIWGGGNGNSWNTYSSGQMSEGIYSKCNNVNPWRSHNGANTIGLTTMTMEHANVRANSSGSNMFDFRAMANQIETRNNTIGHNSFHTSTQTGPPVKFTIMHSMQAAFGPPPSEKDYVIVCPELDANTSRTLIGHNWKPNSKSFIPYKRDFDSAFSNPKNSTPFSVDAAASTAEVMDSEVDLEEEAEIAAVCSHNRKLPEAAQEEDLLKSWKTHFRTVDQLELKMNCSSPVEHTHNNSPSIHPTQINPNLPDFKVFNGSKDYALYKGKIGLAPTPTPTSMDSVNSSTPSSLVSSSSSGFQVHFRVRKHNDKGTQTSVNDVITMSHLEMLHHARNQRLQQNAFFGQEYMAVEYPSSTFSTFRRQPGPASAGGEEAVDFDLMRSAMTARAVLNSFDDGDDDDLYFGSYMDHSRYLQDVDQVITHSNQWAQFPYGPMEFYDNDQDHGLHTNHNVQDASSTWPQPNTSSYFQDRANRAQADRGSFGDGAIGWSNSSLDKESLDGYEAQLGATDLQFAALQQQQMWWQQPNKDDDSVNDAFGHLVSNKGNQSHRKKGSSRLLRNQAPVDALPCRYFLQDGVCRRGAECKFSHNVVSAPQITTCRFWAEGSCLKGPSCPYLHDYLPFYMCNKDSNCDDGNDVFSSSSSSSLFWPCVSPHLYSRSNQSQRQQLGFHYKLESETDFPTLDGQGPGNPMMMTRTNVESSAKVSKNGGLIRRGKKSSRVPIINSSSSSMEESVQSMKGNEEYLNLLSSKSLKGSKWMSSAKRNVSSTGDEEEGEVETFSVGDSDRTESSTPTSSSSLFVKSFDNSSGNMPSWNAVDDLEPNTAGQRIPNYKNRMNDGTGVLTLVGSNLSLNNNAIGWLSGNKSLPSDNGMLLRSISNGESNNKNPKITGNEQREQESPDKHLTSKKKRKNRKRNKNKHAK